MLLFLHGPLGVTSMSTVEAVLYPTPASTVLMLVTPRGPCVSIVLDVTSTKWVRIDYET